ncbi:hypothetical protein CONPUDRAFT_153994 [Coniophora puteana RWD-64-598 SS2]|uniref:Uncharacterized protein n=1 Tax=Coniophora puteana (strain RWD-64-598) TaxID=741705 RepID=A0A5M3MQI4_CONPW|nr:uncharacterized protein CONPUDRAFT_153994 [Coniophora puteana RWD-64-598 SS2]EIW81449.1 hypothetical protein CONPUDRAFT_153994 [Coniophora puteana RWD-64-598 SS2]
MAPGDPTLYNPHWAVIGGRLAEVKKDCPWLACGRDSPPLPVAVQGWTHQEAVDIMCFLKSVIRPLGPTPSTRQLLDVICKDASIRQLLTYRKPFYAVAVGTRVGVFVKQEEALEQMNGMRFPNGVMTSTFRDALLYIVAKGIESLLPDDFVGDKITTVDAISHEIGTLTITEPSSSQAQPILSIPRTKTAATPSTPSRRAVPAHMEPRSPHLATPSSPRVIYDPAPIAYTHIRNLQGIIGTSNQVLPDDLETAELRASLGVYTDYTIRSLGFDKDSVKIICDIVDEMEVANQLFRGHDAYLPGEAWPRVDVQEFESARTFALRLSAYGLPISEGQFLYYMISLGKSTPI